jgi:putative nucleotidyltransferase with HDIG domain
VGTHLGGLDLFDDDRECFVHYPADPESPSGLSSAAVTCIFQDHQGRLWVATYGGGICRFQPSTGEFERFTEKDGLADNVVYGILEDDAGRLWLSTNHGLSRFDPADEAVVRFRNFGVSDGLQGAEFNTGAYHLGRNGAMFFGGVNGLNAFRPETIKDNPYPPAVVLTELELFNRPIAPGELLNGRRIIDCSIVECEVLNLKYDENVFALRFSGLHFADPRANTYAFMLDGFEDRWNRVGERRIATYTRVPPGRYLFKVRAANPDGRWSDNDAVLAIHIEPPFWMTWWFRSIVGLCIAGAVVAAYRLRTARLRDRTRVLEELNDRLEQQVNERLRAETEKDRLLDRVQGMHEALERAYDATLEGWARALELRDHDTEGHTRRVTELTVELARRMGFDDELVEQLRRGAILHDIGKMAIPDSLLGKAEPLTEEDWAVLRKHPDYARRLLEPIGFLRPAMDIPYAHHERWDGSGYPRGLTGLEIPLAARIFAVVDVWDALRSDRPYRPGWPEEQVRLHLVEGAGTLFDPQVIREFLALLEERDADPPEAQPR